ncbi:hypothetical protein PhCBS80983_g04051 [Powellomyces hirtus]|uniref:Uncharacterized protein n=1 Tax=Powellomyces hirtus TaxID=109895 RepID=A0A507DZC7_9FUNG|nr:hypothetical protein PhCBS80983_g04051 [Powellomyces hirtus]
MSSTSEARLRGSSSSSPRFARNNPYLRNATFSYAHALLDAVRYRNTVIPKVMPVMVALALWASVVVVLHTYCGGWVAMDDKLIAILGGSLAMLIAFRSNRGFERYWQGAQLWTSLTTQIRNLSRLIWNGIAAPDALAQAEKQQIMKMLLAVAIATKYALRGENALEQRELRRLLPAGYEGQSYRSSLVEVNALAAVAAAGCGLDETSPLAAAEEDKTTGLATSANHEKQPARRHSRHPALPLPPHPKKIPPLILLRYRSKFGKSGSSALSSSAATALASLSPFAFQPSHLKLGTHNHNPNPITTTTTTSTPSSPTAPPRKPTTTTPDMSDLDGGLVINAPLDIIHRISAYIRRQRKSACLDPEDTPSISAAIGAMIDAVSKFEQILYVPMPNSYDVHMKQILLAYFLALPFQLVRQMGWMVVPVILVTSLAYFGVDAIAGEIEEPFGTDEVGTRLQTERERVCVCVYMRDLLCFGFACRLVRG